MHYIRKCVVVLLLLAVAATWPLASAGEIAEPKIAAEDEPYIVVGKHKDGEKCLGSAGYSWCEKKQKCLRTWEEACA